MTHIFHPIKVGIGCLLFLFSVFCFSPTLWPKSNDHPLKLRGNNLLENNQITNTKPSKNLNYINEIDYCIPEHTYGCSSRRITNITLQGETFSLNNDSECSENTYGDYTSLSPADLIAGNTYDLIVSSDYAIPQNNKVRAWIDYNDDGAFEDSEEIANTGASGLSNPSQSFEFTVPENISSGTYRLRVRLASTGNENLDPCETENYGETEDYTINILNNEDDEGCVATTLPYIESFENLIPPALPECAITQTFLGNTWVTAEAPSTLDFEGNVLRYSYDYINMDAADSWFFTPGIELQAHTTYQINYNFANSDLAASEAQKLKVAYGLSQEATGMDNVLADHSSFEAGEIIPNQEVFSVEQDGVYYFGFQAYSTFLTAPSLYVDDIEIDVYEDSPEYCIPEGMQNNDDEMLNFTLANLNNDSEPLEGENGYNDYTESVEPAELVIEQSYIASITTGTGLGAHGAAIWIDYNDNGIFEEEEMVSFIENTIAANSTVDFPEFEVENALGLHRLRVLYTFNMSGTDFDPCLNSAYSEIEDYMVNVTNQVEEEYCIPEFFYPASEAGIILENVYLEGETITWNLEDIDYNENGYADYSNIQPTDLLLGNSYELEFKTNWDDPQWVNVRAWIDYNQNGEFDEDEEIGYISNGMPASGEASFTVSVPENTQPGIYRLRLMMQFPNSTPEDLTPCGTSNSYGVAIDHNLQVISSDEEICFKPTQLALQNLTANAAYITWTAGNANDELWEVVYGPSGFDPDSEGESILIEDISEVLLSDLTENTDYSVYVRTHCSETSYSVWTGVLEFTTPSESLAPENNYLCNAIELTPNSGCSDGPFTNANAFEELFEPIGSCLNNFAGSNSVWFNFIATDTEAVITTDFSTTEITTEISVYEAPENCTDMTTLGTEVGCAANGENAELTNLTIGETYYIKITGFNGAEGDFCIDVLMDDFVECIAPSEIYVDGIQENQATVYWTAAEDQNQWEVLYGLAGFDHQTEGELAVVNQTEYTMMDLVQNTNYQIFIRATCGEDIFSEWVGPVEFTTQDMSVGNEAFQSFGFYPNPVENFINLNAQLPMEKVEIYNLLGQKVIDKHPDTTELQLDMSQLSSAVYLMKVKIDGKQKSYRLIKR